MPRSSMGSSLTRQLALDDPHDGRPPKRAKQSILPGVSHQHFISQTPKRPLEDVQEFPAVGSHPQIHDLTREGSQADTIEGSSVTSTSKTAAATSAQSEYRTVNNRNTIKAGRQRRKVQEPKPAFSSKDADDTQAVKHRNLAPHSTPHSGAASPDCLAPYPDDDMPLTQITSDLVSLSKRPAPEPNEPVVAKRYKTGDGTEDELSRLNTDGGRKLNNFSKLISQSSRTAKANRGDISRTEFKQIRPIPQGRDVPSRQPSFPELALAGAACGKNSLPANHHESQVRLLLEPGIARVVMNGKGATSHLSWVEVRKSTVLGVKHKSTRSPFVIVNRSAIGEASGFLALKFGSNSHAAIFLEWLADLRKNVELAEPELERSFHHTVKTAEEYDQMKHPSPRPRLEVRLPQRHANAQHNSELRDPFQGEPMKPRPMKLKDRMMNASETAEAAQPERQDVEEVIPVTRVQGPETRRTKRASPARVFRERTPDRWTLKNPGWDKDWHRSLIYPPTGRNRAIVDKDDIPRLDEGEFLNDNLISFYLRHLQIRLEKERPEISNKVHIFNTFFFEKLRSNRGKINYDGVKAWTARIDLLSYDYIVVPVNENAHWYLAIIYNAPRLLPSPEKKDLPSERETVLVEDTAAASPLKRSPLETNKTTISLDEDDPNPTGNGSADDLSTKASAKKSDLPIKTSKRKSTGGNQKFSIEQPRIITLDSLGSAHSPTCKCLRDYLVEEARHKKGVEITEPPGGMTARGIPEQDNYCDCGVFILGYMEHFLKNPDEAVRKLLHKEETRWDIRPSEIRAKVRDLLFTLQKKQHELLEEEKERKRMRRRDAASSSQVAPSSPYTPSEGPQTPRVTQDAKSPLPNGVKTPRVEAPEQSHTISHYFPVISSDKPAQPCTPPRGPEPKLIKPLDDDSVHDAGTSSSGEIYHSARSSPVSNGPQMPVDLTTEQKLSFDTRPHGGKQSTPEFVKKMSSSPKQLTADHTPSTAKRYSSPDIAIVVPRANSSAKVVQRHVVDLDPQVRESIESDRPSRRGPQYGGVDRSIDLTS
ncbi:hypothetical protein FZEAL_1468 [Fusarium zealandicum]|uniref:Ubiquitin-like protease family profile domain-containing protein n=1 Tax=Fusarium zealandicum TaxID=1053134 RepID=A0A8H4USM0_9HYPO|nr:hypothetical protein FZEAL_1468 [Fusarium zealandicum]